MPQCVARGSAPEITVVATGNGPDSSRHIVRELEGLNHKTAQS